MTRNLFAAAIFTLASAFLVLYVWYGEMEGMRVRNARIEGGKLAKGAFDFESNCARCHGLTGEGISGKRLNFLYFKKPDGTEVGTLIEEGRWVGTNQIKEKYGTIRNFIEATATSGIRDTAMLVWSHRFGGPLRDDQITNVASYIMNWQGNLPEGAQQSASTYQAQEIAKAMEGDDPVTVGEAVYKSTCSSCHNLDTTTRVGPGQGGMFGPDGTKSFGHILPNGKKISFENFRDWVHKGSIGYMKELAEPIEPYWDPTKKRTVMTPFATINDKAILSLIAYMSQYDRSAKATLPPLGPNMDFWPKDSSGKLVGLSTFLDNKGNIKPDVDIKKTLKYE